MIGLFTELNVLIATLAGDFQTFGRLHCVSKAWRAVMVDNVDCILAANETVGEKKGTEFTQVFGILHSLHGAHAISAGSVRMWFRKGLPHRDGDAPAFTWPGANMWFTGGNVHRGGDRPSVIASVKKSVVSGQAWKKIDSRLAPLQAVVNEMSIYLDNIVYVWTNAKGEIHRGGGLPAVVACRYIDEWHDVADYGQIDHPDDSTVGCRRWYKAGALHRGGDLPAVDIRGLSFTWYKHGVICRGGDRLQQWYLDGKLHRDNDQPAIVRAGGMQEWYQHGELHRDGNKPAVVDETGVQEWYQHGVLHRDGGRPAVMLPDDRCIDDDADDYVFEADDEDGEDGEADDAE
jgi:hypothetical protein